MDKIHIRDLELYCNHGVYPEETFLGQKFLFDVTLYTNTRPAGLTDDLEKSINYGEISHQIKDYMSSHTYKLLDLQPRICAGSFFCKQKAWKRSIWRSRSPGHRSIFR